MKVLAQSVLGCHRCFSVLLAGLLLLWVPASMAQSASKLSPDAKKTMMAEIADGISLLEAGKTGDPALIPPLRAFATSRRADSFGQHQAVLALAKLGDQKAQQQIVCKFTAMTKLLCRTPQKRICPM